MHEAFVKRVFESQNLAVVSKVEFVEFVHPDANFCFAVVHVHFWIPGIISNHFRDRVNSQREARIVFSDPSYWIVLPYKVKKEAAKIRESPTIAASTASPLSLTPTPIAVAAPSHQCICGCGGRELDCSSRILYNQFTDSIWNISTVPAQLAPPPPAAVWNDREENFRFYDYGIWSN